MAEKRINEDQSITPRHKWARRVYDFSKIYLWATGIWTAFFVGVLMKGGLLHNEHGVYCDYYATHPYIILEYGPCAIQWYFLEYHFFIALMIAGVLQLPFWVALGAAGYQRVRDEGHRFFVWRSADMWADIRADLVRVLHTLSRAYLIITAVPIGLWLLLQARARIFSCGSVYECDFAGTAPWYTIPFYERC